MNRNSVHKSFGVNLLYLCAKHGSIAKVCEDIAINRQQFNKYLTGNSLPNSTNLDKIASFFGLTELDLFQNPDIFIAVTMKKQNDNRPPVVDKIISFHN